MNPRTGKCVHHHVKYKEIHGVDEIVLMTTSEHRLLHNRLRREGICKIPPDELEIISHHARSRSEYGKLQNRMTHKYIPDELIIKIGMLGLDAQAFIKEAIEEKLQRLGEEE